MVRSRIAVLGFFVRHQRQAIVAAICAGALAVILAACGSSNASATAGAGAEPGVSTYLCFDGPASGAAQLLQWNLAGGVINGSYQYAVIDGTAPSEQVSTTSGALAGRLAGPSVTVDLNGSGQRYGTLQGGDLTLNVPQADGTIQPEQCSRATVVDWNSAVSALDSKASTDNQAANERQAEAQQQQDQAQARQQAEQQQANAQQSLTSDVGNLAQAAATLDNDTSLATDVEQGQAALTTEQNDLATEQKDACPGVSSDRATVEGDYSTSLQGALSTLSAGIQQIQDNSVPALRQSLSTVQSDASTLHSLGAAPVTDPSAAIAAANKTLTDTSNAIAWANQHSQTLTAEGQQIENQAQAFGSPEC
jgi:hypothetical protein